MCGSADATYIPLPRVEERFLLVVLDLVRQLVFPYHPAIALMTVNRISDTIRYDTLQLSRC
jgi:hypothetical protein